MCKKSQNPSQCREYFSKTGKSLGPAFCVTIITLTGILAARLIKQDKSVAGRDDRSAKADPEKIQAHLLSALSHDLRTPLSSIMGNSLLYLENHDVLEESEKLQLISHIHEDSVWLINMAENLLAITRIKDEHTISIREEIVEEVLSEALEKMERHHPGCTIRVSIPDDIILLPMNALLIEQVILNLLENAFLHSGSSAPIDIIVKNSSTKVTFTVRDYGRGVPREILDNLSRGMSHRGNTAKYHEKTGIGLAICEAVISAHHGIFAGRNRSRGAEFIFTLPKGVADLQ